MFRKRVKQLEQAEQLKKTKPTKRTRAKQIIIRLSEIEYGVLKQKIEQSGLRQSDFFLRCILHKRIVPRDSLLELTGELRCVGNNINQIAKRVNSGEVLIYSEIQAMRAEYEDVTKQIMSFLKEESSTTDDEIRALVDKLQQLLDKKAKEGNHGNQQS